MGEGITNVTRNEELDNLGGKQIQGRALEHQLRASRPRLLQQSAEEYGLVSYNFDYTTTPTDFTVSFLIGPYAHCPLIQMWRLGYTDDQVSSGALQTEVYQCENNNLYWNKTRINYDFNYSHATLSGNRTEYFWYDVLRQDTGLENEATYL